MLLTITDAREIDGRRLMDIYAESNLENTDFFYPDEKDKETAVRMVEDGFLEFLRNGFFTREGSACFVLEEDGVWESALRITPVGDGLYYMEALETRPDRRKRGCAARLLRAAEDELKKRGPFRLCSCVSKKNEASLRTHLACGFRIVSEEGFDYLSGEADGRDYGMEYAYTGA